MKFVYVELQYLDFDNMMYTFCIYNDTVMIQVFVIQRFLSVSPVECYTGVLEKRPLSVCAKNYKVYAESRLVLPECCLSRGRGDPTLLCVLMIIPNTKIRVGEHYGVRMGLFSAECILLASISGMFTHYIYVTNV